MSLSDEAAWLSGAAFGIGRFRIHQSLSIRLAPLQVRVDSISPGATLKGKGRQDPGLREYLSK